MSGGMINIPFVEGIEIGNGEDESRLERRRRRITTCTRRIGERIE